MSPQMESGAEKCWQRVCLARRTWAVSRMGEWSQNRPVFLRTCPVPQGWKLEMMMIITIVMMKGRTNVYSQ